VRVPRNPLPLFTRILWQPGSTASGAVQSPSNNPSLRALKGESGFDGGRGADLVNQMFGAGSWVLRKRQMEGFDSLKSRVAALKVALRKDGPLPKSAGHSGVDPMGGMNTPRSRIGETPKAESATSSKQPTAAAGKKEPRPAQPVQPEGHVDPLEKVLQTLEGILQAQEQAKAAKGFSI
jgi:hypothetical protein